MITKAETYVHPGQWIGLGIVVLSYWNGIHNVWALLFLFLGAYLYYRAYDVIRTRIESTIQNVHVLFMLHLSSIFLVALTLWGCWMWLS